MVVFRRFLVLVALMFWQGGFTFYAGVVVPVGRRVLGNDLEQGFVTREVSWYMNLVGAAALAVLAWDLVGAKDRAGWRAGVRALSWLGMAAGLVALFWLHPRLDALIDVESHALVNRKVFRTLHRWYLWVATFQWFFGLTYAWLTVAMWRREDGGKAM